MYAFGNSASFAMEDHRQTPSSSSSSAYMFRPIPEPNFTAEPSSAVAANNPLLAAALSGVHDRLCLLSSTTTARRRMNSGVELGSPTANVRPTPKLHSCYRNNQEVWSSAGSRHSSRPGSSASSRPSSQCNSLYNRSNNGSLTDVSVARNFQQLSVSTRRAAFKTQKWSHSFDQGCVSSAQTSPGRRRQASLQQKSLDLDSGYLGSSAGDLKSSCASHSQSSWTNEHNPPAAAVVSTCSPISLASQELRELKHELEEEAKAASFLSASTNGGGWCPSFEDDLLSRSASLPSFPESFHSSAGGSLRRHMMEKVLPVLESAGDLTVANCPPPGAEDQLDEEIKMIVALGRRQQQHPAPEEVVEEEEVIDEDVLSFLSRHCMMTDTAVKEEEREEVPSTPAYLHRPEPTKPLDPVLYSAVRHKPLNFVASCEVSTTLFSTFNISSPPPPPTSAASSTAAAAVTKRRLVRSKTMPECPLVLPDNPKIKQEQKEVDQDLVSRSRGEGKKTIVQY
jgi:hypothetical protein